MRKHHAHNASDTAISDSEWHQSFQYFVMELPLHCIVSQKISPKRIEHWRLVEHGAFMNHLHNGPVAWTTGGTRWDTVGPEKHQYFCFFAGFCHSLSIFEKSLLWSFVSFLISFLVLQGEGQRFLDVLLLRLERRMGVHRMAGWLRRLGTPKGHRQSSHVAVQFQHKPIAIHGSKSGRW